MGNGSNDQTDARFVEAGQGVPQIQRGPSAMLAAISRICRSSEEHGNTPARGASTAATKSTVTNSSPVNTCRARLTATSPKSPRHSHCR